MDILSFLSKIKEGNVSGDFDLVNHQDELMDRDFNSINFENCKMVGGDFASTSFKDCSFKNVEIKEAALVGVTFSKCTFDNTTLINVQSDFDLEGCSVISLRQTRRA